MIFLASKITLRLALRCNKNKFVYQATRTYTPRNSGNLLGQWRFIFLCSLVYSATFYELHAHQGVEWHKYYECFSTEILNQPTNLPKFRSSCP